MERATIDTNVLMEGLTTLGPAGEVVDAWAGRRFQPCVSTALALEYESVLQRKLNPRRWALVTRALQALLSRCTWVPIVWTWRPISPDPADDLVVDCVFNSRSLLVTRNARDFREPARRLGFTVLTPEAFLKRL